MNTPMQTAAVALALPIIVAVATAQRVPPASQSNDAALLKTARVIHDRIIALDTKHNLLSRFAGVTVRLGAQRLPQRWYARVLTQEEGFYRLGLSNHAELEQLLADLRGERIAIEDLALAETDLEQVFLRVMHDDAVAHGIA